ncbi:hypothetical protein [Mycobacterium canetti]|uniref:hypothetical protein n=1 Tax=Mycobacterium canetti TaxID=78331 RepID=UPI000316B2B2|nr:hypothetical protein [Mycobacterium canetti]
MTHDDLPKHLFAVAALHARRALTAAESTIDQLDRAASIGITVELLAKAALALIAPSLVADKDQKSALLFSGIPVIRPHEAKTRQATDCLMILKHSHSVNYNSQSTDSKVFAVRNLALHVGQVDPSQTEDALNAMVRICEEILQVVLQFDTTLDRERFWSNEFLMQVDERLKEVREARRLELEQLKGAARRSYELLQRRGLDDETFQQLADRDPGFDYHDLAPGSTDDPERPRCPVCQYNGWLHFEPIGRGSVYTDYDERLEEGHELVDVTLEAKGFVCGVCGLDLNAEFLSLEGMDDVRVVACEPTQEELDAEEEYYIRRYLEDHGIDGTH